MTTLFLIYAILLTAMDRREIFLEAVFLWNTPLLAALLISEIADFNAASAAALSFASTAVFTFLTAVLTVERIALFLAAFLRSTKILFFADLIFATFYTSQS